MKIRRLGIVNVNLEYEIPNNEDSEEYLQNVELPKEYVEDSFEIVKIVIEDENGNIIGEENNGI